MRFLLAHPLIGEFILDEDTVYKEEDTKVKVASSALKAHTLWYGQKNGIISIWAFRGCVSVAYTPIILMSPSGILWMMMSWLLSPCRWSGTKICSFYVDKGHPEVSWKKGSIIICKYSP